MVPGLQLVRDHKTPAGSSVYMSDQYRSTITFADTGSIENQRALGPTMKGDPFRQEGSCNATCNCCKCYVSLCLNFVEDMGQCKSYPSPTICINCDHLAKSLFHTVHHCADNDMLLFT